LNLHELPEFPLGHATKEVGMFARRVSMHLKPNSAAEFTQKLEKQVIPLLRKQAGFQDEITFIGSGGTKAFGISLWESKENAETYNRGTYAEVTKLLAGVVEGRPEVETYDVCNSTFHKVGAATA
jgi:heme-degrading monooxygenase HmoA